MLSTNNIVGFQISLLWIINVKHGVSDHITKNWYKLSTSNSHEALEAWHDFWSKKKFETNKTIQNQSPVFLVI